MVLGEVQQQLIRAVLERWRRERESPREQPYGLRRVDSDARRSVVEGPDFAAVPARVRVFVLVKVSFFRPLAGGW
jgi:hypothetical protein